MSYLGTFSAVGEVSADDRQRIAIGKAGVRRNDRYAIAVNQDGQILLTPLVSIPKRELLIWENAAVREGLAKALQESAAGDVTYRGSFSEFADGEDEDVSA